jgi:hypothetical protein
MATTSSSSRAQAQAQVTVYASLPRTVAHGADIDLHPSNWEWAPCLTLPVTKLNSLHLSKRPYKWIRYAIGVVIGAQGDLSTSSGLSESNDVQLVDYNAALPTKSIDLYYHTSNEEKQMMFPIDPDILHTQLTSSATSQKRGSFRKGIIARDGRNCIWTGMGTKFCEVVHLIAHTKSDQVCYIYSQSSLLTMAIVVHLDFDSLPWTRQ